MAIAQDRLRPKADSDISDLPAQEWDLLVVGGGTAGIVGAKTAAGFGARVLLVERERTGGDCLWTGCVPSKSLLAAAAAAADARAATRFGVHTGEVRVDFTGVMAHVRSAIAAIAPADSVEALESAGVHVVTGNLTFTGTHTADIAVIDDDGDAGGRSVVFAQALVATGASPEQRRTVERRDRRRAHPAEPARDSPRDPDAGGAALPAGGRSALRAGEG